MGRSFVELIRLDKVSYAYPGRPGVLKDLDFSLEEGQRLGIVGPNGAGKSTLFQLCMGLVKPQAGTVYGLGRPCHDEKEFRPLRQKVGYLFQDPDDQLFCLTVAEDVAFGPLNLGKGRHQALHLVSSTLKSLGMEGYERRVTYQLSGGEKRLISLAAVLAMQPSAVLLDEPGTGLDQERAADMERALVDSDLSWAMVSHDLEFLERTCDQVLRLTDGRLQA